MTSSVPGGEERVRSLQFFGVGEYLYRNTISKIYMHSTLNCRMQNKKQK